MADNKESYKQDIWPGERDYMARPERYRYLRRAANPDTCVFCTARDEGVKFESLCLMRGQHSMVVLNKYPYNSGHVMVLPTRHCGKITLLTDEEYAEIMQTLKRTMAIIDQAYSPAGMNVGLNQGAVAGAGLPDHLHWHVIPRWAGDTNFFPLIAETKVIPETIEQTYERLLPYFQSAGPK